MAPQRRGIAPAVAALIIALVAGGAAALYMLSRPASEQPLAVAGAGQFLERVEVEYTAVFTFGLARDGLRITIYHQAQGPVDVYVLAEVGEGGYEVVASSEALQSGGALVVNTLRAPLYVLAVDPGGLADAIVVDQVPTVIGESRSYTGRHPDPLSLAQHVRVKVRWWDIIWEQWAGAWSLATALRFTAGVVAGILPYAGALWVLWFLSAVARSIAEFTIEPIMDFFYKNYQIIHGIYSLVLSVVLKIIDLITGPAT